MVVQVFNPRISEFEASLVYTGGPCLEPSPTNLKCLFIYLMCAAALVWREVWGQIAGVSFLHRVGLGHQAPSQVLAAVFWPADPTLLVSRSQGAVLLVDKGGRYSSCHRADCVIPQEETRFRVIKQSSPPAGSALLSQGDLLFYLYSIA